MTLYKKMGNEKAYKERFVWLSHNAGLARCEVSVHWAKTNRKDVVNKALSLYDVDDIVEGEPAKSQTRFSTTENFSRCWSINHKVPSKPSLDLQAFEIEQRKLWVDGLTWILKNCNLSVNVPSKTSEDVK
jgi:hypothetical protein